MLKRIGLWLFFVVLAGTLSAQSDAGKIKGIVTDENGPVEYATVVIIQSGVIKGGATTDEKGEYSIVPVSPGVYEVKASYAGNNSVVTGVDVAANKTIAVDVNLSTGVEMKTVEIFETIQIDQTTQGGALSSEQIQQSGIRNVNTLAAMVPGVYQSDDGGSLSMRGGRSSGTTYFIDGVKVRGVTTLPQKAIGQLTVITGGTPAEYGDMIGGVISITTASPSYQFTGGAELITSQFLDPYGYNLIGLNASGPIISKYIDSMDYNKPILGFFIAGEGEFQKDSDPAFGGVAKIKDENYLDYQQNPLTLDESGNFFYSRGNFIKPEEIERSKFKLNNRDDRYRVTMRLDFAPTDNITVKFGGNYRFSLPKAISVLTEASSVDGHVSSRPSRLLKTQRLKTFSTCSRLTIRATRESLPTATMAETSSTMDLSGTSTTTLKKSIVTSSQVRKDMTRTSLQMAIITLPASPRKTSLLIPPTPKSH
jgi:hypothetical protein